MKSIKRTKSKIRYAVVGLGYIAQVAVLPAFANAKRNSELVALISDDDEKLRKIGRKYGVKHTFNYEAYDECLKGGEIDAVYIALPNHMHRDYTVRAARAGVHVLCEKPMAVTENECSEMIKASEAGSVKLMVGYRLHFDRANLTAVDLIRSGSLGEPRIFNSVFTNQVKDPNNIRLKREAGGGTVYDIGIYCINAARYLFRQEPVEVMATLGNNGQKRFSEVEEMVSAVMRFPDDRFASFTCSFGAADVSTFHVIGTKGDLRLDSAYEYAAERRMKVTVNGKNRVRTFGKQDQFGPELIYFSDCILNDRKPEPSGLEGTNDVKIIRAIYRAAETGRPEQLDLSADRHPDPSQKIDRPPIEKPAMVKAASPSGGKR